MKRFVKGVLNMTVSRAFCAAMFVCVAGSIVVVDAAEYSAQVIKVYDEDEVAALEDAGAQILRRRGDILLCYIPKEDNGGIYPELIQTRPGGVEVAVQVESPK